MRLKDAFNYFYKILQVVCLEKASFMEDKTAFLIEEDYNKLKTYKKCNVETLQLNKIEEAGDYPLLISVYEKLM